jgi:hypothetical protein
MGAYDGISNIIAGDIIMRTYGGDEKYREAMGLETIFETVPCWHQAMFIQIELMKKEKYNSELRIVADYDFMLKCYKKGKSFQFINVPICYYLMGGVSATQSLKTKLETLYVLSLYVRKDEVIKQSVWYKGLVSNAIDENLIYINQSIGKLNKIARELNQNYTKVAVYGFGDMGILLSRRLENICVIFDKNPDGKYCDVCDVVSINKLCEYEYDILVISVLGCEEEIMKDLVEFGVNEKKVVSLGEM